MGLDNHMITGSVPALLPGELPDPHPDMRSRHMRDRANQTDPEHAMTLSRPPTAELAPLRTTRARRGPNRTPNQATSPHRAKITNSITSVTPKGRYLSGGSGLWGLSVLRNLFQAWHVGEVEIMIPSTA